MRVRPLEGFDLERALDLWEELMANGHEVDPRWEPAPAARAAVRDWAAATWPRRDPFAHGWVAEEGGALVGFLAGMPRAPLPVLTTPPSARVTDLYVAPSHRRRGAGRAMVEAFAAAGAEAGYPVLEVGTLVRDARAVGFWRALGLVEQQVVLVRG